MLHGGSGSPLYIQLVLPGRMLNYRQLQPVGQKRLGRDVSVCFGTNPKVKVKEALHRMHTFRVPGNFRVALECNPKVFLRGRSIRNTYFSGWPPLGLYNIKSKPPEPEITFIGHVAFHGLVLPALYWGPVPKRGSTEKSKMCFPPEQGSLNWENFNHTTV